MFKKLWLLTVWLDPSLDYCTCRVFFKTCYIKSTWGIWEIYWTLGDLILPFYSKLKPKILAIMTWIWLILQALAAFFLKKHKKLFWGKNALQLIKKKPLRAFVFYKQYMQLVAMLAKTLARELHICYYKLFCSPFIQ